MLLAFNLVDCSYFYQFWAAFELISSGVAPSFQVRFYFFTKRESSPGGKFFEWHTAEQQA